MRTAIATKTLSQISILGALLIVMGMTPLGGIVIGPMRITTLHIPVIVGGIVGGPVVGAGVGLIFGLYSLFNNITAPTPMSFVFWNPLISVLPRILIGLASAHTYRLIARNLKYRGIASITSALVGTATNTIGVLGLAFLLYAERINETFTVPAGTMLFGIAISNAPAELIASAILVYFIIKLLPKNLYS